MFNPEDYEMSNEEFENAAGLMCGIMGSVMQVGLMALENDSKYRDYFYDHVEGMDDETFNGTVVPVIDWMIESFLAINHSEEGAKEMANLAKLFGNALEEDES